MADLQFPILVNERAEKNPSSYITIRSMDDFSAERTLFYLVGGAIQKADNPRSTSHIKVRSTSGRDVEDDGAYIAYMSLQSLNFENAWDGSIIFTGWLTEAKFYIEGESPLDPDYKNDEDGKVYRFTPPTRKFDNLQLPMYVEIVLNYGVKKLTKRLDEAMVRHNEARIEREEKQAAEAEARRIRREKAAADEAKWLLTEEGKDYAAESGFNREVKKFYSTDFTADDAESEVTTQLVHYLNNVDEVTQERILRSLNSRSYRYPKPRIEIIVTNITNMFKEKETV